jgi:hypothetical protein
MVSWKAMSDGTDRYLIRLGQRLSPKHFQYACASCGLLTATFFFSAFVAAGFIPPAKPSWTPEGTKEHYIHHQVGIHVGCVLMMFSGMFFIPYVSVISAQMRRIPNIPWILPAMQLCAGAANVFTFCIPPMVLAVGAYRTDRSPGMFQLLNDMFWLFAVMPFQTFLPVSWALAYAILIDNREKPLYPKAMALLNFLAPLVFWWSLAVHTVYNGPFAWNGALGFWVPGVFFSSTFSGDTWYLFKAIKAQDEEERAAAAASATVSEVGSTSEDIKNADPCSTTVVHLD